MDRPGWLWAICPICGLRYAYLEYYKPETCGKFDCVHEAAVRKLLGVPILRKDGWLDKTQQETRDGRR